MDNALVGSGWRFPILPDGNGVLRYSNGNENVAQSLRLLLMTSLGERLMRPDFGCAVPRLVFAPGTVQFINLLETTVREAVIEWEPRVELVDVIAELDSEDATHATIDVSYLIRRTNTKQNLVFPFYLAQAGGASGASTP